MNWIVGGLIVAGGVSLILAGTLLYYRSSFRDTFVAGAGVAVLVVVAVACFVAAWAIYALNNNDST